MQKIDNFLSISLQFLILILPLTFILGNLSINIIIILVSLLGITLFRSKIFFYWNNNYILLFFILFFLLILFSSTNRILNEGMDKDWIKSILFFRFLTFFVVISCMVKFKKINLRYFFISCFLVTSFVSLDIIIQYVFGNNIFGFDPISISTKVKYFTGVFRKELIAGGFILMFSIIGLFALPFLLKDKKKSLLILLFVLMSCLFLTSIIFSGNRMPAVMFALFMFLFLFLVKMKKFKTQLIMLVLGILIINLFIILKNENIYNRFINFGKSPNPFIIIEELKKEYPNLKKYENSGNYFFNLPEFHTTKNFTFYSFVTGHQTLYITSIDLFLDNPLLGRGIKSFRNDCKKKIHLPNRICESHPHNFILEILNDVGIVGLILIVVPVLILLFNCYIEYLKGEKRVNNISNWIYLGVILSILVHFFPIKSTGSFFSTFNAGYTFLILGILMGLNEIRIKNEK